MRKLIFVMVGASLLLTGCSPYARLNRPVAELVDTAKIDYVEDGLYINEGMRDTIAEINNLTERYEKEINNAEFDRWYIHPYEGEDRGDRNVTFDNRFIERHGYFDELVDILDRSVSAGLKDYIRKMRTEKLIDNVDKSVVRKIGRTTVYTQDRGDERNYISIRINLLDIVDDYYNEVFDEISNDRYILDDVKLGGKLDLIEFVNAELFHYFGDRDNVQIRYNVYFKEHNLNKVNILLRGKRNMELEDEDIEVFVNLLDSLGLYKGEKDLLMDEYINIFKGDKRKKRIPLKDYDFSINYKKGNTYSSKLQEYRFISIKKK